MSFRKRNEILTNPRGVLPNPRSATAASVAPTPSERAQPISFPPGTRPSPLNGQPVTSTGTPSLDSLLAGNSGLPLGHSLLIEEPGTTDYGGALLRYYAAEGITQGHSVTIVGFGEQWLRDLPAVTGSADVASDEPADKKSSERMKIAWRYERLGAFGSGIGGSRAQAYSPRAPPPGSTSGEAPSQAKQPFCHTFDLTKRLTIPSTTNITFIRPPTLTSSAPFADIISSLSRVLDGPSVAPTHDHPSSIHRVIIPSLLSPALYPPHAAAPQHLLQFIHSLRALLRRHSRRLTIMISLPTELYPRDSGLIRWVELLSDGVVELVPLPRRTAAKSAAPGSGDQEPQGLVRIWKLPVVSEKGGGMGPCLAGVEDLAFLVTRKRFEIMAYSLPPAEEDEEDHGGGGHEGHGHGHSHGISRATKVDLDF